MEHGIDLINPQQPPKTDPHGHGTQIAGEVPASLDIQRKVMVYQASLEADIKEWPRMFTW